MRPDLCKVLTGLLIFCTLTATSAAEERTFTLLERELEYLMVLWPGSYDNVEQLTFEANVGKADVAAGGHQRMHAEILRVDAPAVGTHVLYATEYKNNDPQSTVRRRLYALVADAKADAIRVRQFELADSRRVRAALDDKDAFSELRLSDLESVDGCDILIRRDGDWLAGSVASDTCMESLGYADYDVRISAEQYWFREQLRHPDTDEVAEQIAGFDWYQLERARWFACMLDFPREPGGRPVETLHYIKLHDQGGTFPFTHPDGRDMVLTMRNTWSYGMQRETFVIVVQEDDTSGPTLVYAWGNPGADRIGVNPGYLRVQCDQDSPRQVQLQEWLRPDS